MTDGFPRLYAAASLKHRLLDGDVKDRSGFSAALCRGLIEAGEQPARRRGGAGFSAALCRGLIEAPWRGDHPDHHRGVFRGFMPRPH